jgi:hypothetical protein
MPPIIVDQPWPPDTGEDLRHPNGQLVVCPTLGRSLRVYHDQIVLWATFTPNSHTLPSPNAVLFPVVLDTGFNDAFLMQQRQVETWFTPAFLAGIGQIGPGLPIGRERIPGWDLALWLYPNVPGTRDPDPAGTPVWIDLPLGVPLTPPGSTSTKEKPLLGLRALRLNDLSLRIDGRLQRVWLDAP